MCTAAAVSCGTAQQQRGTRCTAMRPPSSAAPPCAALCSSCCWLLKIGITQLTTALPWSAACIWLHHWAAGSSPHQRSAPSSAPAPMSVTYHIRTRSGPQPQPVSPLGQARTWSCPSHPHRLCLPAGLAAAQASTHMSTTNQASTHMPTTNQASTTSHQLLQSPTVVLPAASRYRHPASPHSLHTHSPPFPAPPHPHTHASPLGQALTLTGCTPAAACCAPWAPGRQPSPPSAPGCSRTP